MCENGAAVLEEGVSEGGLSYSGSEWEAICWWIYVSQWSTKWIGACSNRISKSEILHFNNKVEKRHKVATLCPSAATELLKSSSNAISWLNRFQWKLIWISCKFSFFFSLHFRPFTFALFALLIWKVFLEEFPLACCELRHTYDEKSVFDWYFYWKSRVRGAKWMYFRCWNRILKFYIYFHTHFFNSTRSTWAQRNSGTGDGWTKIRERRKHFTMDISFLLSIHLPPLHGL